MGFGGRGWNAFLIRRAPNRFGDALGNATGDALSRNSDRGTAVNCEVAHNVVTMEDDQN
jgi:hypothetical protein